MLSQGSKLKKSSGCLSATNWRNIVTRCKFLVASLYHVNDTAHSQGFWYFTWSQSHEIHKTVQNTAKFGRNLIQIHICTTYSKLFSATGLFTCRKLVNLSWNFVTKMCKQHPETTRRRLCCEKLGTSHDVKGFAIVSVLERIVVERANDSLLEKQ